MCHQKSLEGLGDYGLHTRRRPGFHLFSGFFTEFAPCGFGHNHAFIEEKKEGVVRKSKC